MGAVLFSPLHFPRLLGWRALGFFALFVAAISAWAWSGVLLTTQVVPFDDLSIVSANYEVDGQVVGTLGVIGPTRMPYERMIQIVDITSKLVTNALSHRK